MLNPSVPVALNAICSRYVVTVASAFPVPNKIRLGSLEEKVTHLATELG
jgi:hypothetical protein